MLAAVIGGSAVVAMGALTMAITQEQATPADRHWQLGHERRRDDDAGDAAAGARDHDRGTGRQGPPFGGAGS